MSRSVYNLLDDYLFDVICFFVAFIQQLRFCDLPSLPFILCIPFLSPVVELLVEILSFQLQPPTTQDEKIKFGIHHIV